MLAESVHADQMRGRAAIWRPWDLSSSSAAETRLHKMVPGGSRRVPASAEVFRHPVRLFLPRSRTQEYLSQLGRMVLASFPVQATLHFYNDEDSSSEEDEDGETHTH